MEGSLDHEGMVHPSKGASKAGTSSQLVPTLPSEGTSLHSVALTLWLSRQNGRATTLAQQSTANHVAGNLVKVPTTSSNPCHSPVTTLLARPQC